MFQLKLENFYCSDTKILTGSLSMKMFVHYCSAFSDTGWAG